MTGALSIRRHARMRTIACAACGGDLVLDAVHNAGTLDRPGPIVGAYLQCTACSATAFVRGRANDG